MKKVVLTICMAVGCCFQMMGQQLTLKVTHVSESKGHIRVAIFNNEDDFLQKPVAAFAVEAVKGEVVIPCNGLPKGTYAISLFHDLNDNGYLEFEIIFYSDSVKNIVYKVEWLDKDGFVLRDVLSEDYQALRIPARQKVVLRKLAADARAQDFRIEIRKN